MCLSDIVLEYQKHCLEALKENFVLMRVEGLRRDCVLSHVSSIDYAKTVLDQYRLIHRIKRINICLGMTLLGLLLLWTDTLKLGESFHRLAPDVLLDLQSLSLLLQLHLNEGDHWPSTRRLL